MKTIVLMVKERLGIGMLLSKKYQAKGLTLETLSLAQKILDKVLIDEEEKKKIKFRVENGRFIWELKKDAGKTIDLNQDQTKFLQDIIKELSETKELSLEDTYLVELVQKLHE